MKSGQVILICGMFLFAFFLISGTSVRPYGWAPEIGPGLIFPVMAIICLLMMVRMMGGRHSGGMGCMDHGHDEEKGPLNILKERYARGEITDAEYPKMKDALLD